MKVSFEGVIIPPDPDTLPLPEYRVLEGGELEEAREQMRVWLRRYDNGELVGK